MVNITDKYKESSLNSFPNVLYDYLKGKKRRVYLNEDFDFNDFKEMLRFELSIFSYNYLSLLNNNFEESKEFLIEKARLKECIDDILDDENLLNNFTIYKIQQFINKVTKDLVKNDCKSFETVSKNDKCIKFEEVEIDMSNMIGFVNEENVRKYLYKEFSLKGMSKEELSNSPLLEKENFNNPYYLDDINKLFFMAGIGIDKEGHPITDNTTIVRYLSEGCVANRIPKKKLRKVAKKEVEEFSYSEIDR